MAQKVMLDASMQCHTMQREFVGYYTVGQLDTLHSDDEEYCAQAPPRTNGCFDLSRLHTSHLCRESFYTEFIFTKSEKPQLQQHCNVLYLTGVGIEI